MFSQETKIQVEDWSDNNDERWWKEWDLNIWTYHRTRATSTGSDSPRCREGLVSGLIRSSARQRSSNITFFYQKFSKIWPNGFFNGLSNVVVWFLSRCCPMSGAENSAQTPRPGPLWSCQLIEAVPEIKNGQFWERAKKNKISVEWNILNYLPEIYGSCSSQFISYIWWLFNDSMIHYDTSYEMLAKAPHHMPSFKWTCHVRHGRWLSDHICWTLIPWVRGAAVHILFPNLSWNHQTLRFQNPFGSFWILLLLWRIHSSATPAFSRMTLENWLQVPGVFPQPQRLALVGSRVWILNNSIQISSDF